MAAPVILCVSTGRCGTRQVARALKRTYRFRLAVEHEPIAWRYRTRTLLRRTDDPAALAEAPEVPVHLDRVARRARWRGYLEAGWPCYAALPLFAARFPGRLRLVHIVRNPVHQACSLLKLNWYAPPAPDRERRQPYWRTCGLRPDDAGVARADAAANWDAMSAYEKVLFNWTEVNRYALEFRAANPDIPGHEVRFEDLVDRDSDAWRGLLDFLGVPVRSRFRDRLLEGGNARDRRLPAPVDWREIHRHPETVAMAGRFGYDLDAIRDEDIVRRYPGAAG